MESGAGGTEEEELGARASLDEWPPPGSSTPMDGRKDNTSRLLFLTVEYVGEPGAPLSFGGGEQFISDLGQRVVSPLDPDMSCAACYSPVPYSVDRRPSPHQQPLDTNGGNNENSQESVLSNNYMNAQSGRSLPSPLSAPPGTPSSPLSGFSQSPIPTTDASGMIVMDSQYTLPTTTSSDNYVITTPCMSSEYQAACEPVSESDSILRDTLTLDSADKLLLHTASTDIDQHSELVELPEGIKVDDGVRQIELLLENGGVTLGVIDQDSRVIQIPRECLMAARSNTSEITANEDDNAYLKNIYNSIKSQGLVVETGEDGGIRLVSFLDPVDETLDPMINEAMVVEETVQNTTSLPLEQPKSTNNKEFTGQDWIINDYERCEDCHSSLRGECSVHRVASIIADKPVPSRARATLPASYLAINELTLLSTANVSAFGIFARKTIPNRTQFGPIEGVLVKHEDPAVVIDSPLEFLLESESGEMRWLDVSNENTSNWMRFVRPARHVKEQNLVLSQQGHSLYFTSIRAIHPRQELLVWYSPPYAAKRNLPPLEPADKTEWPCFECDKKFKSSEELQKHLNTHETVRDDKYEMKTRSKKAGHQAVLRRKTQTYLPPIKKYKLNETKSNNEQRNPPFECSCCKRLFPRLYSLKRHLLLHSTDKKYRTYCTLDYTHPFNHDRHIRKQHSNKITTNPILPPGADQKQLENNEWWLCNRCNLMFPSASCLNLHTLVHAADNLEESILTGLPSDYNNVYQEGEFLVENGDVQCPQCTKLFRNKRDLIEHVSTHGQKKQQDNQTLPTKVVVAPPSKFPCDNCYKSFANAERLQRHKLVHGTDDVKPQQCNICPKRFLNNSALACHLKTHTTMKAFECPMCKQSFKQVLALKAHVHSHSKNGMFTCPHCQKEFDEYSQIRKHIRSFHCDRRFICGYCGKLFHTQDKLRMHMLKHSDHREFLCANCGKQFKRKDKLKEHMKRMHSAERDQKNQPKPPRTPPVKKFVPKVVVGSSDYERFIFKCHTCMLGFKRRGMLVNHLANRHPDITPDSVPELNLPILKTTRDYYCQYCEKIYKSSSKRKAHILKNHPGAELPMSNRQKGGVPEIPGLPNPTFSQTVGSVTTTPHGCQWCHKQYASKAKLLQHQRKKHLALLPSAQQQPRPGKNMSAGENEPSTGEQRGGAASSNNNTNTANDGGEGGGAVDMDTSAVNATTTAATPTASAGVVGGATAKPTEQLGNPVSLTPAAPQGNLFTLHNLTNAPSQTVIADSILSEYEIATGDADFADGGIIIDAATLKRAVKGDTLSGELLMSELGTSLADLRSLSQDQYLKLIQMPGIVISDTLTDPFYTPYTAR